MRLHDFGFGGGFVLFEAVCAAWFAIAEELGLAFLAVGAEEFGEDFVLD